MELLKDTNLEVAWHVWQARPPQPSLTVVVKGTFTIPAKGWCELADEQALPTGDMHHDDDVERSLRYPSDMDPLKPHGECFVVGSFRAPGQVPVQRSMVAFQIGRVEKQLAITGDRYWHRKRATEPEPFETMELSWERARGGPKNPANPLGRGEVAVMVGDQKRTPLPNIEDTKRLTVSQSDSPRPVGCGPIPRTWASRLALAGTYGEVWQKTRYPWFPTDLQWSYFNAAPLDQQIEGYWTGNEEIWLRHLHPEHPQVHCQLPGIRAHAFLVGAAPGTFTDVGLRLDTITVDADSGLVHCLWRGVTEVAQEDLEDIRHLYVAHHGRDLAPGIDGFRARYHEKAAYQLAVEAKQDAAATASMPPPNLIEVNVLAEAAQDPGAPWAHLDQALTAHGVDNLVVESFRHAAQSNPGIIASVLENALGSADRDFSVERELTAEELLELEMHLSLRMVLDKREEDTGRKRVREAVGNGDSDLSGWDLTGADLSELDLNDLDLREAILVRANLSGTNFSRCRFEGAVLAEAELSLGTFDACSFQDAILSNARAQRVRFHECRFDDAEMPNCYLREARFASCHLPRVVLTSSDIASAMFYETQLEEADLSHSVLSKTRFQRCQLKDATLNGSTADGISLDGCDAPLLRASDETQLDGASFKETVLDGARFRAASLRRANFSLARLGRADFTGALLFESTLTGCDLRAARFDEANMIRISLVRANLMEARLENANLTNADLRGANLFRAELLGAKLEGARLDVASLKGTRIG